MEAQTQYFEPSHSTSLQVGLNVPRVKESDAHEETRPCERPQLPQAECTLGGVRRSSGQVSSWVDAAKNSSAGIFSQAG